MKKSLASLFILCAFLLSSEPMRAQNSDDQQRTAYQAKIAESYRTSDYAEMLSLVEEALILFDRVENPSPEEKIQLDIEYYNVLIPNGNLDKAHQVASGAYDLAIAQDNDEKYGAQIAEILQGIGNIKWFMQEWDSAVPYFKKAIEKTTEVYGYYSPETAENCSLLAVLYSFTPNFNAGLDYGLKAQEIYEKIQPDDKFVLFQQYADNLTSFKKYGDLDKTAELMQKLTAYYHLNRSALANYPHQDFPNLDAAKTVFFYRQLEYATAMQDSLAAERVYARFLKEVMTEGTQPYSPREQNTIAKFSLETGLLFHRSGHYAKAKAYYSNALDFSQRIQYQFGVLQAYWILSSMAADYERWDDVLHYVGLAFENPDFENFNQVMTMRNNLGHAYFEKGNDDEAFRVYSEVLEHYFSADEETNNFYAIQNLNEIAGKYLIMNQRKPDRTYLEEAYKAYHLSSVIFSRLYRGGSFNDQLATYQGQINEGMLLCSILLDEHYQEAAERMEINHSDLLWSRFLDNQSDSALEIDRDHLSFHSFSRAEFDLKKVQNELGRNEMVLRYVLADSMVFAYAITKNDLVLKRLSVGTEALRASIDDYLFDLKNFKTTYVAKSEELFSVLIKPLSVEKYEKLTIINDGFLGYLPFETLIDDDGTFLLENHQITYSSSLKLWEIQNDTHAHHTNKLAAFSPKYEPSFAAHTTDETVQNLVRAGYYELLGAENEATAIHALFDGTLFLAEEATKNNFVSQVSDFDVIHLAMHAVLDEDDPANSSLIFNENEKLFLREFYDLNIPAQLAVLSACNTGVGEIKRGEGVQSLSRAFTYAGVKSTVMSLWPAPDQQTSQIMVSFYENLKDGLNKAQALQHAKLAYLKNTDHEPLKHPFFWAGFVLSGNNSPILVSKPFWQRPLFSIGLLSILAVLLVIRWRRSRHLPKD